MFRQAKRLLLEFGIEVRKLPLHEAYLLQRYYKNGCSVCVVQIGAGDGASDDPFFPLLQRLTWRGVMVEPHPEIFERLRRRYSMKPSVKLEQCAVSDANGTATLHAVDSNLPDAPYFADQIGSLNRSNVLKHGDRINDLARHVHEIPIRTTTYADLVDKHGIQSIDALIIDTEGYDAKVVHQALALSRVPVGMIYFEHVHLPARELEDCVAALNAAGYRVDAADSTNTVAVRKLGAD